MDFGARKKILRGKAILNLSGRDVFASRIPENQRTQSNFYLRIFSQQGRFVTFGETFGFVKGEAMEFSGQKQFLRLCFVSRNLLEKIEVNNY